MESASDHGWACWTEATVDSVALARILVGWMGPHAATQSHPIHGNNAPASMQSMPSRLNVLCFFFVSAPHTRQDQLGSQHL